MKSLRIARSAIPTKLCLVIIFHRRIYRMRLHGALEQRAHARQVCTIRQEQFYLAGSVTNGERIAAQKEECALKKDGGHSAVIGFAA